MKWRRGLFLPLFLICGFAASETRIDKALDELSRVQQFRDISMSPDGSMAAWIEVGSGKNGGASRPYVIYVKDLHDAAASPRRVGDPAASEQGLAWSRDGKLAFLSTSDSPNQLELYVADHPGHGKPRKLTKVEGYLTDPRWSPDGQSIALLWIEGATRVPGATQATVPDSGVVESKIDEQRLAIVNLSSGDVRAISPADTYVYEYDWSPNGKELVYSAAKGEGDANWWVAPIYRIDAASGAVRHLLRPTMQVANLRWSPDGQNIAFIGGLMSDQGVTGGDIYMLPANGGEPRDITPRRSSSPNWFRWLPSSNQMLFTEGVSGDMAVSTLDAASGKTETLWKGADSISFAGDSRNSAVVRSSWTEPPEVWTGPVGQWRQITHANDGSHTEWGQAKSIEWKSDAFHVQGWLLLPQQYDPSRRYPMIVDVHGGPAAEVRAGWPNPRLPLQVFSGLGYFVFMPNPRGSYGEGEEFTRANVKDFGYGDLRDILAGVDEVEKNYPVDDKRIGIAGWSYGGYMTMWAVTQTQRFRAAFAGAGISDWLSYYGENAIDEWMIPYFGASVYDDPAVYAKSSPITFIKNVRTPTLIAVGERDGECPPPQSYEFWHALRTFGVKTELVIYPGEGHGFHKPEDWYDLFGRVAKWFDTNMPVHEFVSRTE